MNRVIFQSSVLFFPGFQAKHILCTNVRDVTTTSKGNTKAKTKKNWTELADKQTTGTRLHLPLSRSEQLLPRTFSRPSRLIVWDRDRAENRERKVTSSCFSRWTRERKRRSLISGQKRREKLEQEAGREEGKKLFFSHTIVVWPQLSQHRMRVMFVWTKNS